MNTAVNYPLVAQTKDASKYVSHAKINWRVATFFGYTIIMFALPLLKLTSGHPKTWLVALAPWSMLVVFAAFAFVWTLVALLLEQWNSFWDGN